MGPHECFGMNYIYYWSAHTEVSPEHFYGPIRNHRLLALNGSTWALSRHKENMHVGSTDQFGKVCVMGSFELKMERGELDEYTSQFQQLAELAGYHELTGMIC